MEEDGGTWAVEAMEREGGKDVCLCGCGCVGVCEKLSDLEICDVISVLLQGWDYVVTTIQISRAISITPMYSMSKEIYYDSDVIGMSKNQVKTCLDSISD